MTRRLRVDPARPDPEAIAEAAAVIRAGGLVAIPTETVYGLAANALDAAAVRALFEAKGRPAYNPVIVHIANAGDLQRVARGIPPLAQELAARFWPGPLTLVLHRQPVIPEVVSGGGDTVGVRVPNHAVTQALIRAAGTPLAAPSANLFTRVSPTTADHVMEQLGDRVAVVLDAGPASVGIESTVVDLTTSPPRLLRPGGVPRAAIEAVTGPLAAAPRFAADAMRPSPGMIERHYAPLTRIELFEPGTLDDVLVRAAAEAKPSPVVAWSRGADASPLLWPMPNDPAEYAARLYAVLHELEQRQVAHAWIEEPPPRPDWEAVRDRLARAAAPRGEA